MLDLLLGPVERYAAIGDTSDLENPKQWLRDFVGGGLTRAGIAVNNETALRYGAVFCATRVLCEPAGFLPLVTYQRTNDNDDRKQASDYSLYDIVKNAPNDKSAAEPFWEGRTQHCINWGGGFSEIERERDSPDSPCVALHSIHPSRVSPASRDEEADGYSYRVRNNDGTATLLQAYEMLHIPGVLTDDAVWGKGIIQCARESIGGGMAVEKYGWQFFASGGQPKGTIKNFTNWQNTEARKNFRMDWREVHSAGPTELALLPPGTEYVPIGIPNDVAQFLETRVMNVRDIARWYRVPLHMLMDLEKASYNSVEIMSLEFITHNLWPWLRRIQGQVNLKLIPRRDRATYYVEHNLASFLRGDLKSRYESYRLAIMMGVMTINEARRLENLSGIGPAGDIHYVPLNMTTTERMMLGLDQQPKPGTGTGSDQDGAFPQANANGRGHRMKLLREQRQEIRGMLDSMVKEAHSKIGDGKAEMIERLRPAVKSSLCAILRNMFMKESNATRRGFERKGDYFHIHKEATFNDWAEDFHPKHRGILAEALQPQVGLLSAIGVTATPDALADQIIADSKSQILAAISAGPATLSALLDTWPTERAEKTADEILKGAA